MNQSFLVACWLLVAALGLVVAYYIALGLRNRNGESFINHLMKRLSENRVRFAPVYLYIYFVSLIGITGGAPLADGTPALRFGALQRLLLAVSRTIHTFALNFELSDEAGKSMAGVINAGGDGAELYAALVYSGFILALISGALIIATFVGRKLLNGLGYTIWRHRKSRLLIIGGNERCITLYRSAKDQSPLIASKPADAARLLEKRVLHSDRDPLPLIKEQIWTVLRNKHGQCAIIIHTENDEENIRLTRYAIEEIQKAYRLSDFRAKHDQLVREKRGEQALDMERELVGILERLQIYVLGSPEYETIYQQMQSASFGILRFTNKYLMTAYRFIDQYPLTEFMSARSDARFLMGNGCVAGDVELNTILIGFGDTNQSIYRASLATNQFIQSDDGGMPKLKKANYHIFSNDDAKSKKSLNHTCFRYRNEFFDDRLECTEDASEYLPLPEYPANVSFYQRDVNEAAFYRELKTICDSAKQSINYILVAIGSDLENIDTAQKIRAKLAEWDLPNDYLFVKIRSTDNEPIIRAMEQDRILPFGNEDEYVYRYQSIVNEKIEHMARMRNLMYALEDSATSADFAVKNKSDAETCAKYSWFSMPLEKRQSNIYAALSMRMKLQLMGLDCVERRENAFSLKTNADYFKRYAGENPPKKDGVRSTDRQDVYLYNEMLPPDSFLSNNLRNNMAIQEHYRWNAYMIANGFVPATKRRILSGKVKDYALRTHGNLTTFEGLFQYREMMSANNGTREEDEDVIKYDYQLMDDAWWFLTANGWDIVERARL